MKFQRKKRHVPEISMTSMVDVVLLLLFFFMVSTTFNKQTQVKIKLPSANGPEAETEADTIRLTIDANGVYFLEDADGVMHELLNQKRETLFQALLKRNTKAAATPFIIGADGKAPHQSVITALEAASAAGFSHISFATESKPTAP
ncbi:ExbD/TolR family protein [Methylovulum miyakonense]|uniref:ExbD/TolR family protein n=1 Tax=Methylovulum miyakonense TaxID=645578 RepID=UPI0003798504|nr:biopolymer transporter ExbD [Methylovulum miyakonense]